MQTERSIKQDVESVEQVLQMLTSLQELYVSRMQKMKTSILQSRDYYQGLFQILGQMFLEREALLAKHSHPRGAKDSKLAVLFTGSNKFAGSINREIFASFKEYIESDNCQIVVIGRIGKDLIQQYNLHITYDYLEWGEGSNTITLVEDIARRIVRYSTVRLFFAQYVNLTSQRFLQIDLYKGIKEQVESQKSTGISYIFEPEKPEVIKFFETRVLESYILHTLQELYLALMGARVFRMEESSTNAKKLLRVMDRVRVTVKKERHFRSQISNITRIANVKRVQVAV